MDVIECRRIAEYNFECSVTIEYKNKLIKFNEGTFKCMDECLELCTIFAIEKIKTKKPFKFLCT